MPACSICGADVERIRRHRDGAVITLEPNRDSYTPHRCELEEIPRTAECSCSLIVVIYADGTRRLWPSGELHTNHPARPRVLGADFHDEARTWGKWFNREEKRSAVQEPKPIRMPNRPRPKSQPAPSRSQEPAARPEQARPSNRPYQAPARREQPPTKPQQPIRRTLDV